MVSHKVFLIFINDLNYAIKNFKTFHFDDNTCLLNIKQSIKEMNKSVNKDMKSLLHQLNANKILTVFDTDLKLKMCGKKFYPSHH